MIQSHPINVSLDDTKALLNRSRVQNIDVIVAQLYHLKIRFKVYSNGLRSTQLFNSQTTYLIVLRLFVEAVAQRSEKVNKVACSQSVEERQIILIQLFTFKRFGAITYAFSISFQRRLRKSRAMVFPSGLAAKLAKSVSTSSDRIDLGSSIMLSKL